jgi:hypothetical protein
MNRRILLALAGVLVVGGLSLVLGDDRAARPKIEPKTDEILKKMCACLTEQKHLGIQVEETFDVMSASGQKIQMTNRRKVLVSRPDRLMADSDGDTTRRLFYYDGKTIAVFDPVAKLYATHEAPPTLDAMFDFLHEKLGFTIPTTDFLFSDPYKALTEQVEEGEYIGQHWVGEKKCHHLAFRQRNVDWQLWVDAGEKPLPMKFLITYRRQPAEPQFATVFTWDLTVKPADDAFTFKPPAGVKKIDFLTGKHPPAKAKEPGKP